MTKAIVSLSGGMDSTTLLAHVLNLGYEVQAVSFSYNSKHGTYENAAAVAVAEHYKIPLRFIDLSTVFAHMQSNLLVSGGAIPEGHYEAESMKQTVVPGRNIIFASILAGIAWTEKAEAVYLGIHAGDFAVYPDCRPEFYHAMTHAIETGTDDTVTLEAPFLYISKVGIVRDGLQMGVPYSLTRTCYSDQATACGRCGSCQERLSAFAENGVEDPIDYVSRVILPK